MATDRELAARSMMQAGIGSLSGRPDTTYRDKMHQVMTNAQAAQAGTYGGRRTPDDIRQESINWGQEAGLGNRISFAGERGRDILNPNEMRVNAPSVEGWKHRALRKIEMDRRYGDSSRPNINPYYDNTQGYTENLNDLMGDVGSDIWGGVKEKIGGVGDTISDFLKYGWGDKEDYMEIGGEQVDPDDPNFIRFIENNYMSEGESYIEGIENYREFIEGENQFNRGGILSIL